MVESPQDGGDDVLGLNWVNVRASAQRFLTPRMIGLPAEDLEDASQDVCRKLVEFLRKNGPPRSLEGIVCVIAHGVAADAVKRHARDKRLARDPEIGARIHPSLDTERRLRDAIETAVFLIREYLLLKRAPCVELLDLKLSGHKFSTFAASRGVEPAQVRQTWERCMGRVREAVSKGRLQIPWMPSPARNAP
jgi:DNA-directed RNA polymerase specialized sigma24 family protein